MATKKTTPAKATKKAAPAKTKARRVKKAVKVDTLPGVNKAKTQTLPGMDETEEVP